MQVYILLLLLSLLTKRLTWHLVQKLQGHVTYQKNEKTTCSVDREKQAVEEQRSEHSVRHCERTSWIMKCSRSSERPQSIVAPLVFMCRPVAQIQRCCVTVVLCWYMLWSFHVIIRIANCTSFTHRVRPPRNVFMLSVSKQVSWSIYKRRKSHSHNCARSFTIREYYDFEM